MGFAQALGGIGIGLSTLDAAHRQDQNDAYLQAQRGLALEQGKLQNAALVDQADERRMGMDRLRRQKAYSDEVADLLSKYSLDGGSSGAAPATASPGANPAAGAPVPGGPPAGGLAATPTAAPGAKKGTTTALDSPGFYGMLYSTALKHGMTDSALQVRGQYLAQQQAAVKESAKRAAAQFAATGDPSGMFAFYNSSVPDGQKIVGAQRNEDGSFLLKRDDGQTLVRTPQEMGAAVLSFADSDKFVELYGKQLEAAAKGAEDRKTAAVKGGEDRKTAGQKDAEANKRAGMAAGAQKYAADRGLEGRKYAADAKGAGKADNGDKPAKEATALVYKNFGASALSGIDPASRPAASAQGARAAQLARGGWDAAAAQQQAMKEWDSAVAAAGKKGKPAMPSGPLAPPPGAERAAGAGAASDAANNDEDLYE